MTEPGLQGCSALVPAKSSSPLRAEEGSAANSVTVGYCEYSFVTIFFASPAGLRANLLLIEHSR